jgi:SPOR domain
MRRPSSIEPFTPSSTVTLHPVLQAVLDSLDVQVDEELSRYRRQRRQPGRTGAVLPRPTPPRPTPPRPLDTTAIGILDSSIPRSAPRASIYDAPAPAPVASQFVVPPAAQPAPENTSSTPHWMIEPPLVESSAHPDGLSDAAVGVAEETGAVSEPSGITSYADLADLSAYTPSATLQKLMQQAGPPHSGSPTDYLASSEELLRSIAEEDPALRAEPEPNALLNTLLTPLGIGSMLLLLLSSTTLGYVMMNPATIGWMTSPESSPSASPSVSSSPGTATDSQASAPSPDLSSEEFVNLDLDTLSTLPRNSALGNNTTSKPNAQAGTAKPAERSTAGSTAANRTAASSTNRATTSIPEVPLPQPNLSTVVVPADPPPVVSVPEASIEPAPAPVSPEPIETAPPVVESAPAPEPPAVSYGNVPEVAPAPNRPAPAREPQYYVVTEYSGDSSLESARQAVPDAYVRNLPSEGAKVQLGAFSDETGAQEMLQQLRNQGIEAEVYHPQ